MSKFYRDLAYYGSSLACLASAIFIVFFSEETVSVTGPILVFPVEIEHLPTRVFYPREVFLTANEATFPTSAVKGKCFVMRPADFCVGKLIPPVSSTCTLS